MLGEKNKTISTDRNFDPPLAGDLSEGRVGTEVIASAGLGVLEKAMGLLDIVSKAPTALTFTELLRASQLPKATLHRILATLTREGLLRYAAESKTYPLGFRLLELAHEVWSDFDLRVAAEDELQRLHGVTGAPVHLAVLDRDQMVVIASYGIGRDARNQARVGARWPVHATAVGKIVLSYLDAPRQAELLKKLMLGACTEATLTTTALLQSDLDLCRARSYALEWDEYEVGRMAVAAPILDIEGRAIGALAIGGDSTRMEQAQAHALSAAAIGAARAIAHNAGGQVMTIEPRAQPGASDNFDVRCVAQTGSLLGEGPTWSPRDGALYWVDILTPSIHRYDVNTHTDQEFKLGSMVSVALPKATGGLLIATPSGLMTLDPESKSQRFVCHPEGDRPGNRYNDGKCDRLGRLWIGTLDMGAAANRGSLFRVDADGSWKKMDAGFTVANGLGWSPDNRHMYFTDSARRTIYRYDFDLMAGSIANRAPFIVLDSADGTPDGLTVDEEGCLWVAVWDAWRISRYSPEGRELLRIRIPVPRPTSCCFGGPNLDALYITSASLRLNAQALAAAPMSGGLFVVRNPGVRGLPETIFAG
ncbi:MAG: SMP-30/gluconolactonase/LRE family protein [Variovorax sp.]